jgi:hypothetical protein
MRIFAGKRRSEIIYIILVGLMIFLIIYVYWPFYTISKTQIFSSFELISNKELISYVTNGSCMPCPTSSIKFSTQDACLLSLNQSDGWFCENDYDWKHRKRIHQLQDKRNRNIEKRSEFFIKNWEPTLHCAFAQRIGNVGDGGKWVCDVYKLEAISYVPLIYSLGSNGDFSFEQSLKEVLPLSEIHTFDNKNYTCPSDVCTFHLASLDDGKIDGTKSLKTVIEELGHTQRQIEILKIDIEGSEYLMLEEFFRDSQNTNSDTGNEQKGTQIPYIRQILIEIHLAAELGDEIAIRANELFELLRSNNYAIFHKEPNLYFPDFATEYAFIRLNRAFFIPSS